MTGIYVSVPVVCFRMGHAREYWETHPLPPPSTCYGFILSLVGEEDRRRHVGCRVTAAVLGTPDLSVVLRTLWRIKSKNPPGVGNNKTPGHQELLSGVELILWVDSSEERNAKPTLETRVFEALIPSHRGSIVRYGGLCLGESTHLVDVVSLLSDGLHSRIRTKPASIYLQNRTSGRLTLPVWVDHVGSAKTRYVTGDLVQVSSVTEPPALKEMPKVDPEGKQE